MTTAYEVLESRSSLTSRQDGAHHSLLNGMHTLLDWRDRDPHDAGRSCNELDKKRNDR